MFLELAFHIWTNSRQRVVNGMPQTTVPSFHKHKQQQLSHTLLCCPEESVATDECRGGGVRVLRICKKDMVRISPLSLCLEHYV
jgi:hypothetical protein